MSKESLLIVLAFLVASSLCSTFNVTISCTPCNDPCGFANCYKIVSQLYSAQVCGEQNCILTNNIVMKIDRCDYDLYGNACSSNICYYPNTKGCVQTQLTAAQKAQFTVGTWTQISCGACSSTADCGQCRLIQRKGAPQAIQECIGADCHGVQTVNISVGICPNNLSPQGNLCQYCYNTTATANPLGICINYNNKFNSLAFTSYAKVRTLWQQLYTVMSLVILCIALIAFN